LSQALENEGVSKEGKRGSKEMTAIAAKTSVKIKDIKIGDRFRKDLGDIEALANSIKDVGLLHPIVVNENNELVAGHRRIEAAKKLGWNEVPYTVVNISNLIDGELAENIVRKDFSFSERQAILQEVENRRIGHRQKKGSNLQPFQEQNKGKKSVNIVADYTGTSPRQLSKEKTIVQAINKKPQLKHIIDKLDRGEMSVNQASQIVEEDFSLLLSSEDTEAKREFIRLYGNPDNGPMDSGVYLHDYIVATTKEQNGQLSCWLCMIDAAFYNGHVFEGRYTTKNMYSNDDLVKHILFDHRINSKNEWSKYTPYLPHDDYGYKWDWKANRNRRQTNMN
jgi:hypothetical protein